MGVFSNDHAAELQRSVVTFGRRVWHDPNYVENAVMLQKPLPTDFDQRGLNLYEMLESEEE